MSKTRSALYRVMFSVSGLIIIDVMFSVGVTVFAKVGRYEVYSTKGIREAIGRGVYVKSLDASPRVIWPGDQGAAIREAWIEKRSDYSFTLVMIPFLYSYPIYHELDGYNVCITVADESGILSKGKALFLIEEGRSMNVYKSSATEITYSVQMPTPDVGALPLLLEKDNVIVGRFIVADVPQHD